MENRDVYLEKLPAGHPTKSVFLIMHLAHATPVTFASRIALGQRGTTTANGWQDPTTTRTLSPQ